MTTVDLLTALKAFTEDVTADVLLPVRMQQSDEEQPADAPAAVYLMRLPDSKSATKKAPYILHQAVTGASQQVRGHSTTREAVIRSIFCVYDRDEQTGALRLCELMERFTIAVLKERVIGDQFLLLMESGKNPESLIYPEDTAPYFVGEIVTHWELPPVEREVSYEQAYSYKHIFGD